MPTFLHCVFKTLNNFRFELGPVLMLYGSGITKANATSALRLANEHILGYQLSRAELDCRQPRRSAPWPPGRLAAFSNAGPMSVMFCTPCSFVVVSSNAAHECIAMQRQARLASNIALPPSHQLKRITSSQVAVIAIRSISTTKSGDESRVTPISVLGGG